jgi:acyl carrier protein
MTVATVLSELRPLVARLAPAGAPAPLLDEHLLGADLGFDSVLFVELLLGCEERFSVSLAIEALLDDDISTLGLAEAIASAP